MAAKDASERSTIARIAAYGRWAKCTDPAAATAPARKAALDRFERAVDPDGVLDPEQRAWMAERERHKYFRQLGRKSGAARKARASK